jgi:hypothetical protein
MRLAVSSSPPTLVTFLSTAFNTSEPKKYFINPRCFGDDVANWLMNELTQRDASLDPSIGQEDFGRHVRFRFGRAKYDFIVEFRNADWVGWLELRRTILEWLFGVQNKAVQRDAQLLIHSVLSSSELISDVRWHYKEDFDALNEGGQIRTGNQDN